MTEPTPPSTTTAAAADASTASGGPVDDRREDPPPPASAVHDGDTAATEAQREAQETIRSISRLEESN